MEAVVSPCGAYRYLLLREWSAARPPLAFVMLNPGFADAARDDPTIRRCIGFARREGWGGVVVANLFAYRTPYPSELAAAPEPVGPENEATLRLLAQTSKAPIICAWGANAPGPLCDHAIAVLGAHGAALLCLGRTKSGAPRHPLYVRRDKAFEPFP
ncbi:MAG: DUF1643 domain-containing protein [Methylocystis sp.]|uniref:DUF1643 domain-containing protein n=1 Tax=Methylocystis sp. TaxID=1911079 RepID=UPI003DA4432C